MRPSGRLRASVVLVVLCLVLAATTVDARAADAPSPPAVAPIAWRACDDGFQCGTLTVPLDPAAADGPTLGLAVVRKRARDRTHRIGSLVFNPGGPGAPGVSFLTGVAGTLPRELRDRFDLVALDPRGVGSSRPVECVPSLDPLFDQSFQPATRAARIALVDMMRIVAFECEERSGELLAHLSTADTVQDLERLRVALGDDRLSFVGYSYGTFLGARYADAYPDRVRAFVLDGPVDPTMSAAQVALGQARGFERALDDFLADCSDHPGCPFHHDGDAAPAYDALRARAGRTPLATGGGDGRGLNQTRFDAAVLQELYLGRSAWPALADALHDAERGDASTLLALADAFVGRGTDGRDDHALEAFWAVSCRDGPVIGGVDAAAALETRVVSVAPRLGAFIVNNSLPCSVWPVPPLAPSGRLTATGAPPILVVGTTHDPATPLVQARALSRALDRGRLLVAAGEQHTSFDVGNECVDRAVTRYLVDLKLPRTGTTC
jgi:pimeloyl-ACP methyl ester carboxylesterase